MLTEDQYEVFGIIHKILPENKFIVSARENKVQVFAIKTSTKERREIAFTLYNKDLDKLAHMKPGDPVRVVFELESKSSGEKYFNNIKCINVHKAEGKIFVK